MLTIYNTLTRKKEVFQPIHSGKVNLYACGVTVYDYCHIGHARTNVALDIIVRYLKHSGYQVHYVRNITDIDDKIIKRANESGVDYKTLTATFIKAMHDDFAALELLKPDHEPRATEYLDEMIALIENIIKEGHAYVGENGDVYFDVRSFKNYGALSNHNLEELESGARVEVNEVKKDPLDFVLWKIAKPGEPKWDSPWGEGRPGWHLECSAMSMKLLGNHFDMHAGGRDLIFPHHENEIAQAEAATNEKFVNVWMHAGFLQIEKEKMSKSLGNFITIRDALKKHDGELLRYFYLSSHYRSPLVYAEDAMHSARKALTRLYTALRGMQIDEQTIIKGSALEAKFNVAMDDDFNTPIALSVLFDIAHEVQRLKEKNAVLEAASYAGLLKKLGGVFGIAQKNPESYFQAGDIDHKKIESLINDRNAARASKNWQEADRIRNELAAMSVVIEDGPEGTTWRLG